MQLDLAPTRTRAERAPVAVDPRGLARLVFDEGFELWALPETATRLVSGVAASPEARAARGADLFPRLLEVFDLGPARDQMLKIGLAGLRGIESTAIPHRLAPFLNPRLFEADRQPNRTGRHLVLLHGFLANPVITFCGLDATEEWQRLLAHYDGRVLAFHHPTIGVHPLDNALALVRALDAAGIDQVDLLCHSRGGLIADLLVRPDDAADTGLGDAATASWKALVAARKGLGVDRTVRVGTPGGGSPLAGGELPRLLNGLQFALSFALNVAKVDPGFVAIGTDLLVRALALASEGEELPGYAAMNPEGPFRRFLAAGRPASDHKLDLAADTGPGAGLLLRLADALMDRALFGEDDAHDLVVSARSARRGVPRAWSDHRLYPGAVHHLNYFGKEGPRADLAAHLCEKEARRSARRLRGRVLFVPGVLGSALRGPNGWVWTEADGAAVPPPAADEVAEPLPDAVHAPLLRELERRFDTVEVVAWDWRSPPSGEELARHAPTSDDVVVAHGHGGWLVGRARQATGPVLLLGFPSRADGAAFPEAPWCARSDAPVVTHLAVWGAGRDTASANGDGRVVAPEGAPVVVAEHEDLVADRDLARLWAEVAASDDPRRKLADAVALARRARVEPSAEDLGDRRLSVRVELGVPELDEGRHVVLGHFENDPLGLVEWRYDRDLGDRLKELAHADAFPGPEFTDHVDREQALAVVGLGRGELSGSRLRALLTRSIARLLLTHEPRPEIAVLLPDTSARRIGADVAARAIVEAVLDANARVRVDRRVPALRLFCLHADDGERVAAELRAIARSPRFVGCAVEASVVWGDGHFGKRPDDARSASEEEVFRVRRDGAHGVAWETEGRGSVGRTSRGFVPWWALTRLVEALDAGEEPPSSGKAPAIQAFSRVAFTGDVRRRLAVGRGVVLEVDAAAARVPWELACHADGVPVGKSHALVRRYLPADDERRDERAEAAGRRVVVVADPDGSLPGARLEGRAVAARLRGAGWTVEEVDSPWDSLVAVADCPRVLHVASHGLVRDAAGLVRLGRAGDEALALGAELLDLWDEVPSLVFLNCCYSGAGLPRDEEALALAPDLARELHLLGVRALVVCAWQVDDRDAARFATTFYDAMLAGRRFGDAVREAREQIDRGGKDLAWGAWQAWGDPGFVLDLVGNPVRRLMRPVEDLASWQEVNGQFDTLLGAAHHQARSARGELVRYVDALSRLSEDADSPVLRGRRGEFHRRTAVAYRSVGQLPSALLHFRHAVRHPDAEASAAGDYLDLASRKAFADRDVAACVAAEQELERLARASPIGKWKELHEDARLRVAALVDPRGPLPEGGTDRHHDLARWLVGGRLGEADVVRGLLDRAGARGPLVAPDALIERLYRSAFGAWDDWVADWADLCGVLAEARGTEAPVMRRLAAFSAWKAPQLPPPSRDPERLAPSRLAALVRLEDPTLDPEERWRRLVELEERDPGAVERFVEPEAADLRAARGPRAADDTRDVRSIVEERWPKAVERWSDSDHFPSTVGQLAAIVGEAAKQRFSLRVVGAARAMSEVSNPTGAYLVSLARLSDPFPDLGDASVPPGFRRMKLDAAATSVLGSGKLTERGLYRCEAGRSVASVIADLRRSGRSMLNLGSGSFQGIFSAVTTGTHGSGLKFPPMACFVRAVTWLDHHDGRPRIRVIQPATPGRRVYDHAGPFDVEGHRVEVVADDELFDVVVMSMGCFGVALDVTIEVSPEEVWVRDSRVNETWSEVAANLPDRARDGRWVEFQVDPHDRGGSHTCQVIVRKETDARRREGHRLPALALGRLEIAKELVGEIVRWSLRDPKRFASNARTGLEQTAYGDRVPLQDELTEVVLLDLKYRGEGSEWAVPLAHAKDAVDEILRLSREADQRAYQAAEQGEEELAAAYRQGMPLTASITLRFVRRPAVGAVLSMSANTDGIDEWCVIEVGFLGDPQQERKEPRDRSPLYQAYVDGRRATFRHIDAALRKLGARPHWGLYQAVKVDTATWPAWARWRKEWDVQRPVFNNAFTRIHCGPEGLPVVRASRAAPRSTEAVDALPPRSSAWTFDQFLLEHAYEHRKAAWVGLEAACEGVGTVTRQDFHARLVRSIATPEGTARVLAEAIDAALRDADGATLPWGVLARDRSARRLSWTFSAT